MKSLTAIMVMILFLIAGCGGNKQSTDELITVDVTANYPKKELILQDFMDVEYIPLETNEEFICQGLIQDIGKDVVIVRNRNQDGDIFIFDRTGKAMRKINRKGQGGEEYPGISWVFLNEADSEIFVNCMLERMTLVYDFNGNFKRRIQHHEKYMYYEIYDFDKDNFICQEGFYEALVDYSLYNMGPSFLIASKQDGSVSKEIQIPFEEKKTTIMKYKDSATGQRYSYMPSTVHPIVPYYDNWILSDVSSDTIYSYSPDHIMKPFIARTPPINSMNPEVFLFLSLLTDRYYFMETVRKEDGFPGDDVMYDKQKRAFFRYAVYNADYTNKEVVFMKSKPVNKEIPNRMIIEAPDLVSAYEKGQLKGKLKEIAATLNEESNPVIMLMKYKK